MKAQSISLYHRHGASDKVYNVQLIPEPDGTWSVYAQNGRRGAGLVNRTKVQKVGYHVAQSAYLDLIATKERHPSTPYIRGPLNGKSAEVLPEVIPGVTTAAVSVEVPEPGWEGWDMCLPESATMLGVPLSSLRGDNPRAKLTFAAAVVLADLALSLPEAISEAPQVCARGPSAIEDALQEDCRAWLNLLPLRQKQETLRFLQDNVSA